MSYGNSNDFLIPTTSMKDNLTKTSFDQMSLANAHRKSICFCFRRYEKIILREFLNRITSVYSPNYVHVEIYDPQQHKSLLITSNTEINKFVQRPYRHPFWHFIWVNLTNDEYDRFSRFVDTILKKQQHFSNTDIMCFPLYRFACFSCNKKSKTINCSATAAEMIHVVWGANLKKYTWQYTPDEIADMAKQLQVKKGSPFETQADFCERNPCPENPIHDKSSTSKNDSGTKKKAEDEAHELFKQLQKEREQEVQMEKNFKNMEITTIHSSRVNKYLGNYKSSNHSRQEISGLLKEHMEAKDYLTKQTSYKNNNFSIEDEDDEDEYSENEDL